MNQSSGELPSAVRADTVEGAVLREGSNRSQGNTQREVSHVRGKKVKDWSRSKEKGDESSSVED